MISSSMDRKPGYFQRLMLRLVEVSPKVEDDYSEVLSVAVMKFPEIIGEMFSKLDYKTEEIGGDLLCSPERTTIGCEDRPFFQLDLKRVIGPVEFSVLST
eukprot:UN17647